MIALCVLLMGCGLIVRGQDETAQAAVQVETARYQEAQVIVQVALSSDLTVRQAQLISDDRRYDAQLAAMPSLIEQWFILDGGAGGLNLLPLFKAAIADSITTSETIQRFGLIIYGDGLTISAPQDGSSALQQTLTDYRIMPHVAACPYDALATLAQQTIASDTVRRVLLVAGHGALENCRGSLDEQLPAIDILVVDDPMSEVYLTISQVTGGSLQQSSLRNLENQIRNVLNARSQTVYTLRFDVLQAVRAPQLQMTLSDDRQLQLPLTLVGTYIAPTATPTIEPSFTPSPTSTMTPAPSATPTVTATMTVPAPASATATATAANVAVPSASPTRQANQTAPFTTPWLSNATLILVGGIAAIIVVIVVMTALLWQSRQRNAQIARRQAEFDEQFELTQAVKMRDMMVLKGPTLVARLYSLQDDAVYEVHRPLTTLGRQANSDILIDDRQISREHVHFTVTTDQSVILRRLTQNPVLVNEQAVENIYTLNDNDTIHLAPELAYRFEVVTSQEPS